MDLHGELGGLAGQIGRLVLLGEGHLDGDVIARLGADELGFKARNELIGAEGKLEAFALAAVERNAVDAAEEVDQHLVAVLGLQGLAGARRERPGLLGQLGQGLIHFLVGRRVDRALQLQRRGVDRLEIRHQLDTRPGWSDGPSP